jgi:hypothetical protein
MPSDPHDIAADLRHAASELRTVDAFAESADRLEALAVQLPLMLEVIAAAEKWERCDRSADDDSVAVLELTEETLLAAVRALREGGNDGRLPCRWSNRWSSELDYCGVHDHFRPREALIR